MVDFGTVDLPECQEAPPQKKQKTLTFWAFVLAGVALDTFGKVNGAKIDRFFLVGAS